MEKALGKIFRRGRGIPPERVMHIAREGYNLALADFLNPPIPEPEIEYDEMKTSGFYISEEDWRVHMNVARHPQLGETELLRFFRCMARHEIGHYIYCPYDRINSSFMVAEAASVLDPMRAVFAVNVFADLVVETKLFKMFRDDTLWSLEVIIREAVRVTGSPSALFKILVRTYEYLWGVRFPIRLDIGKREDRIARELANAVRDGIDDENSWPERTRRVAQILRDVLMEEVREGICLGVPAPMLTGCGGSSTGSPMATKPDAEEERSPAEVPKDVIILMRGNPMEIRDKEAAEGKGELSEEDLEKIARRFVERGQDFGKFASASLGLSPMLRGHDLLRFWYRARAASKIEIKMRVKREGSALPAYTTVWRIGDPIEELDIVQSLQTFPVLIPNITTRKWVKRKSERHGEKSAPPDLLIVIDSSGSMFWELWNPAGPSGPYDAALVSAFAALDFAMRKNCRMAVLNFSDEPITCEWTRDRKKVEDCLLTYQGGGTELPIEELIELVQKARDQVLVLIISDAEIYNWKQALRGLMEIASMGHKIVLFLIGGREEDLQSKKFKTFFQMGGKIYPVQDANDLPKMVIEEVRGYYGGE
ncbi:MAG: vWA domain-containing protein [Candidatus Baldrarchaeia archaeon]